MSIGTVSRHDQFIVAYFHRSIISYSELILLPEGFLLVCGWLWFRAVSPVRSLHHKAFECEPPLRAGPAALEE